MKNLLQNDQFQKIVQQLAPASRLLNVVALEGGISAQMSVLEIENPNGVVQRVIVRQPGESAYPENLRAVGKEFKLLKMLHAVGLPVSEPYLLIPAEDKRSSAALVIEYIPGELDFSPVDVESCCQQAASLLACIHSINVSEPEYAFLPRQSSDCPEMARGRKTMVDYAVDISQAVSALSSVACVRPNPACLLHGDFWPGNLLWRDGCLAGVIDWEDACLGEPLSDLAISRLDFHCIFGKEAMDLFTHQYLAITHIDTTDLPYWDLCAVMRMARIIGPDLTDWAAFYPHFGREDITGESIKQSCLVFIDRAISSLK